MGSSGRTDAPKISYSTASSDAVPTSISKRRAPSWKLEPLLVAITASAIDRAKLPKLAGFSAGPDSAAICSATDTIPEQPLAAVYKPVGWAANPSAADSRFDVRTTISSAAAATTTATTTASVTAANWKPVPQNFAITSLYP